MSKNKKYEYNMKVQQKKRSKTSYMHKNKDDETGSLVEKDSFLTKLTVGDGFGEIIIKEGSQNPLPIGQDVKVTLECVQQTLTEPEEGEEPVAQ